MKDWHQIRQSLPGGGRVDGAGTGDDTGPGDGGGQSLAGGGRGDDAGGGGGRRGQSLPGQKLAPDQTDAVRW